MAQNPGEVAEVHAAHGLTPAGYLDLGGFLGPDLVGPHWSYCTRADIKLFAARGVFMARSPASISRRGLHKALLGPIRDAGVTIAIGTDNMSEDMFQVMAFGSIVHRTAPGEAGRRRAASRHFPPRCWTRSPATLPPASARRPRSAPSSRAKRRT